jgi:diguanylate cyclase (GGDEF)-like protein
MVLSSIAESIARHALRASDCAARYGGEEFALILPGLSLAEAIDLGDRIRRDISGQRRDGQCTTTVSIGAASLRPSALTKPAHLIKQADVALYAAKAHGRDQTFPAALLQKRRVA